MRRRGWMWCSATWEMVAWGGSAGFELGAWGGEDCGFWEVGTRGIAGCGGLVAAPGGGA